MTTYIKINDLGYSYPESIEPLLENVNLSFHDNAWYAISGSNGTGKTTLLSLLRGSLKAETGKIETNAKSMLYLPQENMEIPDSVWSSYYSGDNEIGKIFSILQIKEEMLYRQESLSGGERKRIQIATALSEYPDVLILDEPTNHLDSKTKTILLDGLRNYQGIGIIISHDRDFVSELASNTLLFEKRSGHSSSISVYSLPLNKALEVTKERYNENIKKEEERGIKLKGLNTDLRKALEDNSASKGRLSKRSIDPKDHDAKGKIDAARLTNKDYSTSNKVRRIQTQINKIDEEDLKLKRKSGFSIKEEKDFIPPLTVESCTLVAGNYTLNIPNIQIRKGMKISLEGDNGSGKTLLIKKIVGQYPKLITYIPQELTVEDTLKLSHAINSLEDREKGAVLSTFFRLGGEVTAINKPIDKLSPGEKKKLILSLLLERSNIGYLVLDEITNHLDITSIIMLEEVLKNSNISLIFVSHDKSFREAIKTNTIYIKRIGNEGTIETDL